MPSKRLVKNDVLYVVGASFLLVLTGAITRPMSLTLSSVQEGQAVAGDFATFIAYALTFFIAAFFAWKKPGALKAQFGLATTLSIIALLLPQAQGSAAVNAETIAVIARVFLGSGVSLFLVLWMEFLAQRSVHRGQKLLLWSNIIAVFPIMILVLSPQEIRFVVIAFIVLPGLIVCSLLSLQRTKRVNRKDSGYGSYKKAFGNLANPLICAVVFFLVYALTNSSWRGDSASLVEATFVAEGAVAFSVVLLACIWFVWKKDLSIEKFYIIMLPILATLFLLAHTVENINPLILSFVGNTCMATMSIMMIFVCLAVSKKYSVNCQVVYGVFVGAVYLAKLPELFLPQLISMSVLPVELPLFSLLLYLLTIPGIFMLRSFYARKREPQNASSMEAQCRQIAQSYNLSKRQDEILVLLAKGRDVPYIANELVLSQNTVRTYKKSLYAACNIHSRQELVSLVERQVPSEE